MHVRACMGCMFEDEPLLHLARLNVAGTVGVEPLKRGAVLGGGARRELQHLAQRHHVLRVAQHVARHLELQHEGRQLVAGRRELRVKLLRTRKAKRRWAPQWRWRLPGA